MQPAVINWILYGFAECGIMFTDLAEQVVAVSTILKSIMSMVIFAFALWVVYFADNNNYSFLQGVFAFIALLFVTGILSQFPFGTTFTPVLFEWWWLDIGFTEISGMAWSLTAISMILNGVLIGFVMGASTAEDH